jgi:hypothetical protein
VCPDPYGCRWQIEVFIKQIKQGSQSCDFLGNSANAVRWQVWTVLLLYLLMRFLCVMRQLEPLFHKALHAATSGPLEKN